MATFTAGTSFTDGVTGDVTAAKLNALVANATPLSNFITDRTAETSIATDDLVLISDTSDSGALNKMTVANLMKAEITGTINSTAGTITTATIPTLTAGTTTGTAATFTSGTITTLNSTTGTITTGVIPTLTSTTLITSGTGTAAAPAIVPTGDTNTGIFFPAADTIAFSEGGTEAMRIDSSWKVLIGTTSNDTAGRLEVKQASSETGIGIQSSGTDDSKLYFRTASGSYGGDIIFNGSYVKFSSGTTERIRIASDGALCIGRTTYDLDSNTGVCFRDGSGVFTANGGSPIFANRKGNDGIIVGLYQDATLEGNISVSGNTVSYNPFAGSHWSQLEDGSKPEILRGTVIESINQLCQWPDGGNERFAKCKISDTVASNKVYGVFLDWDNDWTQTNDLYVTSVGLFICRINSSVNVQIGDLLESNGDGTARVQSDNVIKSSTIGKVTSSVKTHEYQDGSYCVPTVLYCG